MKFPLRLIALISLAAIVGLCFNQGAVAYARWQQQKSVAAELNDLQRQLGKLQEQKAAIITEIGAGGGQEVLLRDVMADFLLMLKELPPELSVAGIAYDQAVTDNIAAAAANNDLGLSFLGLNLDLRYTDYAAAVAVFLEWFAYSPLPIIVKRLDARPGSMSIKMEIYGLPSAP